ncbi:MULTISPECIES: glycosyltransferase [unclassified Photobacterium]|uniref:glycosyltransferase n=1 Tax=unclassified Photobacterium TaxID=2628852 RepID=UPI001EE03CC5|nr:MULTISPECIES: glycosyltransferase [unclassified Photobacterium]MCG3864089.1 glycosyltransferase [Photobacterium sp. Ph6]MCG3875619.1 glycosyltransferase [Photobacterium sp. Ph5]
MNNSFTYNFFIPKLTIGGAETVFVNTCEEINKRGGNVIIITLYSDVKYHINPNITIINVKSIFGFIKYAHRLNKKNNVIFSFMERANLINLLSYIFLSSNSVLSVHTAPHKGFKKRKLINRALIRFTYKLASFTNIKTVVVSEGIKNDLTSLFGMNNIKTIPNFLLSDEQKFIQDKKQNKDIIITFVGRLEYIKGCDILLEALYKSSNNDIKLNIIGDGSQKKILEDYVVMNKLKEKVNFTGTLSSNQVYSYLSESNYLIIPSYAEGFGMVVLEGLKNQCKIIYSSCDFGPRDLMEGNFKYVKSYPFYDPSIDRSLSVDELSEILNNLDRDVYSKDECEKILRTLSEEYSADVIIPNLIKFLSNK